MQKVMEVTRAVRFLRVEAQLLPSKKAKVVLLAGSPETESALLAGLETLKKLALVEDVLLTCSLPEKPRQALSATAGDVEVYLPLAGLVDLTQEVARLKKELQELESEIERVTAKLSNQGFLAKAPGGVVESEREKEARYRSRHLEVQNRIKDLTRSV